MKTAKRLLSNNKGQMLVIVLLVMLILMILLLAIMVNLRGDIRETQSEREYEKGYSISEDEVFQMAQDIDDWVGTANITSQTSDCPDDAASIPGIDIKTCTTYFLDRLGDDGLGAATCWEYEVSNIRDVEIRKDEALEIQLDGYNGSVSFSTSSSLGYGFSIGVVSENGGEYESRKVAYKVGASNFNAPDFSTVGNTVDIGALNLIPTGYTSKLMRVRVIIDGTDPESKVMFEEVSGGSGFPNQMVEYRCKSEPSGVGEGQPEPDVYTRKMLKPRLPAIFDYVLFVGEGAVVKD